MKIFFHGIIYRADEDKQKLFRGFKHTIKEKQTNGLTGPHLIGSFNVATNFSPMGSLNENVSGT